MTSRAQPPVYGGILVGGASRRMGSPKALLELEGVTFFDRAAQALAPLVERTVLLGRGALPASADCFARVDDLETPGPLGGLLAAFAFAPQAAWIVVACDLPLISAEALRWLTLQRSAEHWAVLPAVSAGRVEPLAALYEPNAAPHLRTLAQSGRLSLQPLGAMRGVLTPAPPPDLARCWSNVNTPDELARLGGAVGRG